MAVDLPERVKRLEKAGSWRLRQANAWRGPAFSPWGLVKNLDCRRIPWLFAAWRAWAFLGGGSGGKWLTFRAGVRASIPVAGERRGV